jgi:acetolactate synthase-1/3 small subunit
MEVEIMANEQIIVSLLVNNHFGVLTRISGLFSRRCFNIESLTVGETENPKISRMTIVTYGDEYVKDQIVKQLSKQIDVKTVQIMDSANTVVRELVIVKIASKKSERTEILEAVNAFRANVIDFSTNSISVELTGEISKINAFIEYVSSYGIIELCRTGSTAIGRNGYCLTEKKKTNKGGK